MADQLLYAKADIFNACMKDMTARLGTSVTQKQVIESEVRKILEKTIKNTDTATRASVEESIKTRGDWRTYNGKKYKITNRFPDGVWNMITGRLDASLKRKLAAISLSRKAWWTLGIMIGPTDAPAQTKRAVSKVDQSVNVGVAKDESVNGNYGLTITNSSPLIGVSKGRQALFSAIAGRIGFYKQNLKRGVFNDLALVAKKYPGIEFKQ